MDANTLLSTSSSQKGPHRDLRSLRLGTRPTLPVRRAQRERSCLGEIRSRGGEEAAQEIHNRVQKHGGNQRLSPGYECAEEECHCCDGYNKLPRQADVQRSEQTGLQKHRLGKATCPCVELLLQVAAVEKLLSFEFKDEE